MKKIITTSAVVFALITQLASASVTIQFTAGSIRQADNSLAAIGSKGLLVADTGSDGFIGDYINSAADFGSFDNTTLAVGQTIGGSSNDQIIGVFDVTDFGGGFVGFNDVINFNLGTVAATQQLALYWFPTVSGASISGSLTEYGFFRTDTVDSGADIAFVVSPDGSNDILSATDSSIDGTSPSPSQLTATAVPEPSAFALLAGAFGIAAVMVRRRR